MLISLNGVLIVVFELAIIAVVRHLRPQPVIAVGYLLVGVGFALTGVSRTLPTLAATVVIWTLGEMISSPMTSAYVAEIAPEQYRGRYMGMWVLAWSVGLMLGPPIGTMLLAHNATLLWTSCGALGVLAAALVSVRPTERTSETLTTTPDAFHPP